jgi:hypothetical protein
LDRINGIFGINRIEVREGADSTAVFFLKFETGGTKVQKETFVNFCGGEVIDELHLVRGSEFLDGFIFDDECVIYEHVSIENTDDGIFIMNIEADFGAYLKAGLPEFKCEGVLIDGFKETGAKDGVDFHGNANDLPSEVIG